MRILLIDDHPPMRMGLMLLLDSGREPHEFVQADSVESAVGLGGHFDLVLLDMHLPGVSGTDALARVRNDISCSRIVVVSGDEDPALISRCIELGACGYIPKTSKAEVLASAIQLVLADGVYLPTPVLKAPPRVKLTAQQHRVFSMLVLGKRNKEIAAEMGISESGVKRYLEDAFAILGVKTRTEAVYRYRELELHKYVPAPTTVA